MNVMETFCIDHTGLIYNIRQMGKCASMYASFHFKTLRRTTDFKRNRESKITQNKLYNQLKS